MPFPRWLDRNAQRVVDGLFATLPRSRPSSEMFQRARLVAHRGAHDKAGVIENTREAFQAAVESGLWGIEFDVRFTRDAVPVVHHDPDTRRLFKKALPIQEISFSELRREVPQIPSLDEVLEIAPPSVHLMMEMKMRPDGFRAAQIEAIRQRLQNREPGRDWHFLALKLEIFEAFAWVPREARMAVSEINVSPLAEAVRARQDIGAFSGHYALITSRLQREFSDRGIAVGTGFTGSTNCLYREVGRGIDWIFTNHALKMQKSLDVERARDTGGSNPKQSPRDVSTGAPALAANSDQNRRESQSRAKSAQNAFQIENVDGPPSGM